MSVQKIRLLDSMMNSILSLKYLEEGYTRAAAEKAFHSWKSFIIAYLFMNTSKMVDIRVPRDVYSRIAELPNDKVGELTDALEEMGLSELAYLTKIACQLNRYFEGDLESPLHPYHSQDAVKSDIILLLSEIFKIINKIKRSDEWNKELENSFNYLKREMERVLGP